MWAIPIVLASIVAYMMSPAIGAAIVGAIVLWVSFRAGRGRLEKLLTLLVMTFPLYMLPIFPGLHHFASWTTILLIAALFVCSARIKRLSPATLVLLLFAVPLSVLTGVATSGDSDGWYYTAQFLLFVLPPVAAYEARDWVGASINADASRRLLVVLASTLLATGTAVLVQWQAHTQLGIVIGNISFFHARTTYDLTIPAYSVLSGILAVGVVLAPILIRRGFWLLALALAITSAAAIVINSARTGLVVGLIVLTLSLIFPPRGVKRGKARLALIPAAVFGWWAFDYFIALAGRGSSLDTLLDDNGRFDTFQNAFDRLFRDETTPMVGLGYADYQGTPPHNFIVETAASSGLGTGACVVVLLIGLLWYLRGTDWQYPIWALIGGSMLYSGFYAVKAAVVIAVLMIAFRASQQHYGTQSLLEVPPIDSEAPRATVK